jgi:hypothetical protein
MNINCNFRWKMKKIGTTGHFYKKFKEIFFRHFFHLKLKIVISDLKNSFRFVFSGPKLAEIDTHIAILPRFSRRSGPELAPRGAWSNFFHRIRIPWPQISLEAPFFRVFSLCALKRHKLLQILWGADRILLKLV